MNNISQRPQGGFPPIVLKSKQVKVDMNRGFSSTIVDIANIINYKQKKVQMDAFGEQNI